MKILIATNSGFQVRYLLQTDIFKRFLNQNIDLNIIAFPNEIDLIKEITNNRVNIIAEPQRPKKNFIEKYLGYMRFFTRAQYNSTSVEIYKRMYNLGKTPFRKFGIYLLFLISNLIKKSVLLRMFFVYFEKYASNYSEYKKILKKIKPDFVLLASHGSFGFDKYIAYSAQSLNIKIFTVILSWDNVTSQTYPAYYANYVIAWTEVMKRDILRLIDYHDDQVIVAGSAYFDNYFKKHEFNKKKFLKENNFNLDKKIILFATRSPNSYPWHPNIAESISKIINNDPDFLNWQLIIRPHPIHYRKDESGNMIYQEVLDQYEKLNKEFSNVFIDYPKVFKSSKSFLMNNNDSINLVNLLRSADILVNIFSTMNIEAAICDIPIINICYEYEKPMYKFNIQNPRFNIYSDIKESHNQRIVDSGGTAIAYNEQQLIYHLKSYILNPNKDKIGRQKIVDREVGPYRGYAGETIADTIIGFAKEK
tara:strand:- start:270 stop:1700 length:1431 start_codon:yes stop_codon:yes gene_type:complete